MALTCFLFIQYGCLYRDEFIVCLGSIGALVGNANLPFEQETKMHASFFFTLLPFCLTLIMAGISDGSDTSAMAFPMLFGYGGLVGKKY